MNEPKNGERWLWDCDPVTIIDDHPDSYGAVGVKKRDGQKSYVRRHRLSPIPPLTPADISMPEAMWVARRKGVIAAGCRMSEEAIRRVWDDADHYLELTVTKVVQR